MNGTTHKIGGAIMSLTVSLQTGIYKPSMSMDAGVVPMIQELSLFGILIAGSILGATMPDIDHKNSQISHKHKFLSFVTRLFCTHRGFTHSVPALLILSGILFGIKQLLSPEIVFYYSPLMIGIILGYVSHMILDLFNPLGIPLFYPLPFRMKVANIKTNGLGAVVVELIVIYILFCIILCYLRYYFF